MDINSSYVVSLSLPPSLPLEITFVIAGSQSTASPLWPVHFTVDVISCPEHALSCAMRDTASQQALAKEIIAEIPGFRVLCDLPPN